MTKKNLPNIPLYIGDWEKDCNVLSLEAEAAWLRIIFKMFTNGKQSTYKIPKTGLQRLWRKPEEIVNEILQELTDYNICEIKIDGRFIEFTSRRYQRENEISEIRREAVSNREDRQNSTNDLQKPYKKDTKDVQNTEIDNEIDNKNDNKNEFDPQKIVDIFNSLNHNLPKVQKLTKQRKAAINSRIKEYGLKEIGDVFNSVVESRFLNGENDRGWTADFDWIMKPTNFIKILEGKYNNGKSNKTLDIYSNIMRDIANGEF